MTLIISRSYKTRSSAIMQGLPGLHKIKGPAINGLGQLSSLEKQRILHSSKFKYKTKLDFVLVRDKVNVERYIFPRNISILLFRI